MQSKITKGMGASDGFDEEDQKLMVLEQLIAEMDDLEGEELSVYKAEKPDMAAEEVATGVATDELGAEAMGEGEMLEGEGAALEAEGEVLDEAAPVDTETEELRAMVRQLLARKSAA